MNPRLTKPSGSCKKAFGALVLFLLVTGQGQAAAETLRDCVAKAGSAAAVSACEQQHQLKLKQSIRHLTAAIRARLDRTQRPIFDRSIQAWQDFLNRESAMLSLSLGLRADGLGPKLEQGSITRLYEQREQQLREHLHSLSLTPAGNGPDRD